jgi:hypothetical protein
MGFAHEALEDPSPERVLGLEMIEDAKWDVQEHEAAVKTREPGEVLRCESWFIEVDLRLECSDIPIDLDCLGVGRQSQSVCLRLGYLPRTLDGSIASRREVGAPSAEQIPARSQG